MERAWGVGVLAIGMLVFASSVAVAQVSWPSRDDVKKAQQKAKKELKKQEAQVLKTLAELEKLGLEAPPDLTKVKGPRKSIQKLLAPFKGKLEVKLSDKEVAAAASRAAAYLELEKKASPEVRARLERLRAAIKKKGLSFQVGVTSVSDKLVVDITGLAPQKRDPKVSQDNDKKRAELKDKPNLIKETRIARATLPPAAPARQVERRDPADGPVGAADWIVAPENTSGTTGGWFPTSQIPSLTNPQFSWRDRMTPVKNQVGCGSCWAFAATAAFEASQMLQNGQSLDLSEQHLVNCVPVFPGLPHNCKGNVASDALGWLTANPDADEATVPYVNKERSDWKTYACSPTSSRSEYKVASWNFVAKRPWKPTVEEIKAALITHGPVTSNVYVSDTWKDYTGGVVDEGPSDKTNHAVVIVGWDDARQAWHVRNSWGDKNPAWGEDGYIWIRYGSSAIGEFAAWVDAAKIPKPVQTDTLFADRYLSVKNDTDEDLRLFAQVQVLSGATWKWVPAKPTPTAKAWSWTVPKGKVLDLVEPGTTKYVRTKELRLWATSLDGKRVWGTFRDKNLPLVPAPYRAVLRERYVVPFAKPAVPPITPDSLLTEAHRLRDARDFPGARAKFQSFTEMFPSELRIHQVRFWIGWTYNQEAKHWEALRALYDMAFAAPGDEPFLGYAFYYQGMSGAALGYCGYAVRNFEVVAYGEIGPSPEWVNLAQSQIAYLHKDDGKVCANWD